MLASTLTVDWASGRSVAVTSSGDTHDLVVQRSGPAANTASRSRQTVRAANMSPVPLK